MVSAKKGISAVVATVLVVLITVVAVAIIWMGVIPIVSDNINFGETIVDLKIVTDGGYTTWDSGTSILSLQIKRGSDESDLDGIQVVFDMPGGGSVPFQLNKSEVPSPNQAKVYYFNLDEKPLGAKIAPIFDGVIGEVTSEVKVFGVATQGPPAGTQVYNPGDGSSGDGSGTTRITLDCNDAGDCSVGECEVVAGCISGKCVIDNKTVGTPCGVDGTCDGAGDCYVPPVRVMLDVDDCMELSESGVYTLISNVASSGTCFNITTDHVVLNGASHTVDTSAGNSVVVGGDKTNVTIKNTVVNSDTYSGIVFLGGITSSLVEGNTVRSGISGCSDMYYCAGVAFYGDTVNGVVDGNTITQESPASPAGGALLFSGNSDSDIINNVIVSNSAAGIFFFRNSGASIKGNSISSFLHGIETYDTSDNIVIEGNSNIGSSFGSAIFFDGEGGSLISNPTISSNEIGTGTSGCNDLDYYCSGVVFVGDSSGALVENNNMALPFEDAYGVYFNSAYDGLVCSGNTFLGGVDATFPTGLC